MWESLFNPRGIKLLWLKSLGKNGTLNEILIFENTKFCEAMSCRTPMVVTWHDKSLVEETSSKAAANSVMEATHRLL